MLYIYIYIYKEELSPENRKEKKNERDLITTGEYHEMHIGRRMEVGVNLQTTHLSLSLQLSCEKMVVLIHNLLPSRYIDNKCMPMGTEKRIVYY